MKTPSNALVREATNRELRGKPQSVRDLVQSLLQFCDFEYVETELAIRPRNLTEQNRDMIVKQLACMAKTVREEALRILHYIPLLRPLESLARQMQIPDESPPRPTHLSQDSLRGKLMNLLKAKHPNLTRESLRFCKWWLQHCDIRCITTGASRVYLRAIPGDKFFTDQTVSRQFETLLKTLNDSDIPALQSLLSDNTGIISKAIRAMRDRARSIPHKNSPFILSMRQRLRTDIETQPPDCREFLFRIDKKMAPAGSVFCRHAREFYDELDSNFPNTPLDDTDALEEIAQLHRIFASDMTPMLDAARAGLVRTALAMFRELSEEQLPEDMEKAMQLLKRIGIMLQIVMMEAEDAAGRGASGITMTANLQVSSSVCQSLLLKYLHARFPKFLLVLEANNPSASECRNELSTLLQRMDQLLEMIRRSANPVDAMMYSVTREWLESCKAFFAAASLGREVHKNGNPDRSDAVRGIPIGARLTTIGASCRNGTSAGIISTTQTLSGLGPVASRSVWSGEIPVTAWMWEQGDKPCHNPHSLLAPGYFLPKTSIGVVGLDFVASEINHDLSEWKDTCASMGIASQLQFLQEDGFAPHILRIGSPRRNDTSVSYKRFLIVEARTKELLWNPTKMRICGDMSAQIEELKKYGISFPEEPLIFEQLQHEPADEQASAVSPPKIEENSSSNRLQRIKSALALIGRKPIYSLNEALKLLGKAGVVLQEEKGGAKHYKYVSQSQNAPRPWRTAESKPLKNKKILVQTLSDILFHVGDLDALEKYAEQTAS